MQNNLTKPKPDSGHLLRHPASKQIKPTDPTASTVLLTGQGNQCRLLKNTSKRRKACEDVETSAILAPQLILVLHYFLAVNFDFYIIVGFSAYRISVIYSF